MPARICQEDPYAYEEQSERLVAPQTRSHNPRSSMQGRRQGRCSMLPLIANFLPETLINKIYFRRAVFFSGLFFVLVYACASGIDSPSAGLLRGKSATLP